MARGVEVAGLSLPGTAHATLSTRPRGPYCVRPWSCCWARHPCRSQAAGKRYPLHLAAAPANDATSCHEEWLSQTGFSLSCAWLARSFITRHVHGRGGRALAPSRVSANTSAGARLFHASAKPSTFGRPASSCHGGMGEELGRVAPPPFVEAEDGEGCALSAA